MQGTSSRLIPAQATPAHSQHPALPLPCPTAHLCPHRPPCAQTSPVQPPPQSWRCPHRRRQPRALPSPSAALHGCRRVPKPDPSGQLCPGADPLPRLLRAPTRAGSPQSGQPPGPPSALRAAPCPGQGGLRAPGANGFAGEKQRSRGGLPGGPWWHPHACTAPNSPSLSIKGSIFFPRSPQRRVPGRALQPLPRRGLSKFYYSALLPPHHLPPPLPSSSIPSKTTAAAMPAAERLKKNTQGKVGARGTLAGVAWGSTPVPFACGHCPFWVRGPCSPGAPGRGGQRFPPCLSTTRCRGAPELGIPSRPVPLAWGVPALRG